MWSLFAAPWLDCPVKTYYISCEKHGDVLTEFSVRATFEELTSFLLSLSNVVDVRRMRRLPNAMRRRRKGGYSMEYSAT